MFNFQFKTKHKSLEGLLGNHLSRMYYNDAKKDKTIHFYLSERKIRTWTKDGKIVEIKF